MIGIKFNGIINYEGQAPLEVLVATSGESMEDAAQGFERFLLAVGYSQRTIDDYYHGDGLTEEDCNAIIDDKNEAEEKLARAEEEIGRLNKIVVDMGREDRRASEKYK